VVGACRPALAHVECNEPHNRPVDLRLETGGHPSVTQDASDLTPLEPGGFDAGADFRYEVAVGSDGRAEVLKVQRLRAVWRLWQWCRQSACRFLGIKFWPG